MGEQTFRDREEDFRLVVGSFAHAARYASRYDHLCPSCSGLKSEKYKECFTCISLQKQALQLNGGLADATYFGFYAVKGTQMYRTMFQYKIPRMNDVRIVASILEDTFITHYDDFIQEMGESPTAWATIPSQTDSRRYGRPHPLRIIAKSIFSQIGIPEVILECDSAKSDYSGNRRGYSPDIFHVSGGVDETNGHVLLIDDSWTTGHSIQSAAGALKQSGIQRVTAFCIARIIDGEYWEKQLGSEVFSVFSNLPFEPHNPWKRKKEY
ncbi:hypothetical protein B9G54_01910 [Alloscardovia macacae]|uniref:Phosphoribosyltransferase domain-containing protein n=1 Tax=Alloscardovia macacae TaxID=1160091 RepID=A0A1Y2SVL6_9BIFI|nr:phosphoribosyltransferase [Alloscardovia macacae]OTA27299.1 hypothetical protein B9G54_01910 [Alloscardovia macacae]OTA29309.1 hypothetical protein B9T39_04105 [Alloscardovia macacae]